MSEFNVIDKERMPEKKVLKQKKNNAFARVMKAVFVHNIGYKILAFATGIAVWLLMLI